MEQSKIYAVLWEITMACNSACVYCYNAFQVSRPLAKSSSVSKENALAIADKIIEADIQTVVISGGEPTTQPDIVLEVGKYLRKHCKKVSVITNGTLITDELARELAWADIEVFVSLTAPFESLHDETVGKEGAYKKTIYGIQLLVEKPSVTIIVRQLPAEI
uniref:Radical SAM protein n=1 Tax=Anaerolinea thermolimosa TaxID=229919 RepID=A0A7C4PLE9_9CHLR